MSILLVLRYQLIYSQKMVPTGPGKPEKSWNLITTFSKTQKILEKGYRSWQVLQIVNLN